MSKRVICVFTIFLAICTQITGEPVDIGCTSDSMCPPSQACINRACVNPCRSKNPCSSLAICTTLNHQAQCSCRSGFTGDAYQQCVPSKHSGNSIHIFLIYQFLIFLVKVGECQFDSECPDSKSCIENFCQDPCKTPYNPCGEQAQCRAIYHRAVCQCPPEWAGNPHVQCFQCELYIFQNLNISFQFKKNYR